MVSVWCSMTRCVYLQKPQCINAVTLPWRHSLSLCLHSPLYRKLIKHFYGLSTVDDVAQACDPCMHSNQLLRWYTSLTSLVICSPDEVIRLSLLRVPQYVIREFCPMVLQRWRRWVHMLHDFSYSVLIIWTSPCTCMTNSALLLYLSDC